MWDKVIQALRTSLTLKGLLVAGLAYVLDRAGLKDQFPDVAGYVDQGINVLGALGLIAAGYGRVFRPNPNLTVTAARKEQAGGANAISTPAVREEVSSIAKSHWAIGLLVGLLVFLPLLGACSGTMAAYKAADTPDKVAYVVLEHYAAVVQQAANLKASGQLAGAELAQVQQLEQKTYPKMKSLEKASVDYTQLKSAKTTTELQNAINQAALDLSDLITAIKGVK